MEENNLYHLYICIVHVCTINYFIGHWLADIDLSKKYQTLY